MSETKITQIKWNTGMPEPKDLINKIVIVEWINGFFDYYEKNDPEKFVNNIVWDNVKHHAILADEPVFCEWTKVNGGVIQGCTEHMLLSNNSTDNENLIYCWHCGNHVHIRVIEEVKPMELDGVLPEIKQDENMVGKWSCKYITSNAIYEIFGDNKRQAIENANGFVERMKK